MSALLTVTFSTLKGMAIAIAAVNVAVLALAIFWLVTSHRSRESQKKAKTKKFIDK